ncbi:MAG: hypothetical protein AAF703_05320 [Cyanobacteria bacterium P01_D01_bin.105]
MATPNRLNLDRLKSAMGPFIKLAQVITPTGVGVLLSVGAHAALIAAGPRLNVSFDALTKENLEANPEETIVPILQLSPAEQNRLPSFAQPRRSPTTTGLSSLPLPSGLPSFPNNRRITKRPSIPSRPIPSPSLGQTRSLPRIGQTIPNRTVQPTPFKLNFPVGETGLPSPAPARTPYIATPPPEPELNSGEGAAPVRRIDRNGISVLEPTVPGNDAANGSSENSAASDENPSNGVPNGISLSEILRGTEGAGIAVNPTEDPTNSEASVGTPPTGESGATLIPVEDDADVIAAAPADGDPARLLKGSKIYSAVGVSDEEAQENLQAWLNSTAEGKEQVAVGTTEMVIDSGFKACRKVAPVNGLIGVLVNPDGTRESIEMLKSTGYGSLNSLALSTLDYEEFEPPEVPTLYQVNVDVIYGPEGCVENLPETPSEDTAS